MNAPARNAQHRTSVSALLNLAVLADGRVAGRVREFAVAPQVDAMHVTALVLKGARGGPALVHVRDLERDQATSVLRVKAAGEVAAFQDGSEYLMLERDLLDQQIIDVDGHKVVRVNDVDLVWETDEAGTLWLRIAEVEIGVRGALRRLLKGLPRQAVERVACQVRPSVIPWQFVDLIDRDPARRVRLKIEQDKLARMHPSDLADILEELAPAEGQALFQSLDEEVAADALEEVDVRTQKKLIESLDSERVAGIIEEMDPGAAADLLAELSEERSESILEEMDEQQRHEVEELLDYAPDSAAGLMTTDYLAVPVGAAVSDGLAAARAFEDDLDGVTDLYLVDDAGCLQGVVSLAKLLVAEGPTAMAELDRERPGHPGHVVSSELNTPGRRVAELFDKYNLRSLPVVDHAGRLAGVVRAEQVIAWLRTQM